LFAQSLLLIQIWIVYIYTISCLHKLSWPTFENKFFISW
jgi:hypothetical protein